MAYIQKGKFLEAEIIRREDVTSNLWKIWIKSENRLVFAPGQYCTIGAELIERPYSIASSPDEPAIELFVDLLPAPEGKLTPILHKSKVGDKLTLRPRAKGRFVLQPQFKQHVLMGTGTGIVPYVSILRKFLNDDGWPGNGIDRSKYQFHILNGISYQDEFGYREELSRMASENDFIEFMPSISRPQECRNNSWTGATGRINELVEDYINDRNLDPLDTCIYACGHPMMIEDVRKKFKNSGYQFVEERFWKDVG